MPRNTREWAKRKLEESKTNLEWSVYHLKDVSDRYMEQHPEIGKPLIDLMEIILTIHANITTISGEF